MMFPSSKLWVLYGLSLFSSSLLAKTPAPPYDFSIPIEPFKLAVPQEQLDEMYNLLKTAKLAPPTYESTQSSMGVTRQWVIDSRDYWKKKFDWRKVEDDLNKNMPQYTAKVKNKKGEEFTIHFVGIWSNSEDAVPLVLLHGWPGAFLEFQPLIEKLKKSTNPKYHIIAPSLPGYAFSSSPPVDRDFSIMDIAELINELMEGLGFKSGYLVQAGDVGQWVARILTQYEGCKGILLNMFTPIAGISTHEEDFAGATEREKKALLEQTYEYLKTRSGYAVEHATRPSTIGHVLASNPLALLAWVGEKLIDWADGGNFSLDNVLRIVTLYWLTETFPTSIYPYRHVFLPSHAEAMSPHMKIHKPFGVAWFEKDLLPYPKAATEKYGDLVFFERHDKGGHWPMIEVPNDLAKDIIEFTKIVWKKKAAHEEL